MKIAPSILSADYANLADAVQMVEHAGAEYIHIDVMDGQFVPNITFGPGIVAALKSKTNLPLDCHLMITQPENYIGDFISAGADIINVHVEATNHLHRIIQQVQYAGIKAGVTINPATPVSLIREVLPLVDLVLVMTVNPGFGGQRFIPETLSKVKELASLRESEGYFYEIEVDGGITDLTLPACIKAGADVFVAGSYIYGAPDPVAQIQILRNQIVSPT